MQSWRSKRGPTSPSVLGARVPFKNEADLQRFLDGLLRAGLPE